MAKQFNKLSSALSDFIRQQKIFFVGTAMKTGKVNVSPKGMNSFHIVDPNCVVWLNLTGSGNETAAHLLDTNRMTIMFCAFEGAPLILRLYGSANTYHERDAKFHDYLSHFSNPIGARQIFELKIELVQTSCGYGVPLMDYQEDRTRLVEWSEEKGESGIKAYWEQKNTVSLDGQETQILG